MRSMPDFEIVSKMTTKGDQPQAIDKLAARIAAGERYSTLLGVTGSVKTLTMAQVVSAVAVLVYVNLNLGEARGYSVNLLNASGAIGTQAICGGTRSSIFTGGGLPPSPVTALIPINGKPTSVLFGGAHRSGGASSSIGAQQLKASMSGRRTRIYWHTHGNK